MNNSLGELIHDKALECGYENCGVIPIDALDDYKRHLETRIGQFPESASVYGSAFLKLRENYPWAVSAVICTEYYGKYKYPVSLRGRYAKAFLLSSSVPEYPGRLGKKNFEEWLHTAGIRFAGGETNLPGRIFPLRQAALAAGLGIIRKNNFFYGPNGSYYNLEGYLINQPCEYIQEVKLKPCAEKCNLCQKACKTHALSGPYSMNPTLCVSLWTTFGGGIVPGHLSFDQFGEWIMGCDACQDACPHNIRHNWDEGEDFPGLNELEPLLQPESIIAASDEELITRILPRSDHHLSTETINVLRICAQRVLDYQGNSQ